MEGKFTQHQSTQCQPSQGFFSCCQMQGELEGSTRYRELMRSAEHFFKQSVAFESRWGLCLCTCMSMWPCHVRGWALWVHSVYTCSQCLVPWQGDSPVDAERPSFEPGRTEGARATAPPRGRWVNLSIQIEWRNWLNQCNFMTVHVLLPFMSHLECLKIAFQHIPIIVSICSI